jgi:class 3 adenylate cyclase
VLPDSIGREASMLTGVNEGPRAGRRMNATGIAACTGWTAVRAMRFEHPETAMERIVDSLDVKRRLTCILSADAVGYSSQMGRDEEGTIRVLAAHRAVIDGIIVFHQGRIVGTAGDSVLAEFASAVEGVRCAIEIQDAISTRNDSLPEERRMLFRVGVNLGDVVVQDGDLLGDGVNVAARLQSIAEPGGICISSSVYDQITGKLDLGFQDIGDRMLKNISRPIHVYRLSGAGKRAVVHRSAPKPARWSAALLVAATAAGMLLAAAGVAWKTGWLRGDASSRGPSSTTVALPSSTPAAAPSPAPTPQSTNADGTAGRMQAEADVARIRVEAEALKRQAESELARTRAEAEAARAARVRADAEAAAARVRAQAEADAARIRAEAAPPAAKPAPQARTDATTTAPVPPKGAFDGSWQVEMRCAALANGAAGFTVVFPARVVDSRILGERGKEGAPDSLRMEGEIRADGSALLGVRGFTADPKFNPRRLPPGSPYRYQVTARFDGASGTGTRNDRPCELAFRRQ